MHAHLLSLGVVQPLRHLVEDVVVALALRLVRHTALLQQVRADVRAHDAARGRAGSAGAALRGEEQLGELAEAGAVVVQIGLGVAQALEDRVGLRHARSSVPLAEFAALGRCTQANAHALTARICCSIAAAPPDAAADAAPSCCVVSARCRMRYLADSVLPLPLSPHTMIDWQRDHRM